MDNVKLKMSDITIIDKKPIKAVNVRVFDVVSCLEEKSITCEYIFELINSRICSLFPCKIVYSINHENLINNN